VSRRDVDPGEEFVSVLEGSVTQWQKGKEEILGKAGKPERVLV
jgi:uncharacterized cupin superfamily protein